MATSGSVDFSLTARQVVTQALQRIRVLAAGETPTAQEAADALVVLNLMLKTWGTKQRLWIKTEGTVALTASTATYSLTNARRVMSVRRRTSSIDTPLMELSREEYFDLPNKSSTGVPTSYYFDPQRASRTLYVWPTPTTGVAASTALHYTYARVIEDVDSLDNTLDLPQEWLEAIIYNLGARLMPDYGVDDPRITEMAGGLLAELGADSEEDASIYLQPDYAR